jgi:ribose transport system permease protein
MSATRTLNTAQPQFVDSAPAWLRALKLAAPLAIAILALSIALYVYEPRFLSGPNISNLLRGASLLAVIAAGQMLVMIIGGFDLSVGGTAALSSVTTALAMTALGESFPEASLLVAIGGVAVGLLTGPLVGLVNGAVIAGFGAPPFMVTLGTLSAVSGTAFYLTSGTPVYGLPDEFTKAFARGNLLGISFLVWVSFLVVFVVWALQNLTGFGRHTRALGSNRNATRLSGVAVTTYTVTVYMLSGLFASVVGVLLTARLGSGQSTIGLELMLQSIAVAVVGGVSLRGGSGRIGGIVLAAVFFSVVTNGMNMVRIDSRIQTIVIGLIIIVATLAERLARNRGRP